MRRPERPAVDLRRLRYFVAVCDHGGFTRAAQAIGVAQPALTRQVQLLETEIGLVLFTRNGRSALPTAEGARLLAAVRAHLDGIDMAVERVRRDAAGGPVALALGICPTISPLFREALDEALRHLGGQVAGTVIEAYSGDLASLMAAGRLDAALSYDPESTRGLVVTPLMTEPLVFAARGTARRGPVGLAELAAARLILPSPVHALRRIIDRAAAARGLGLRPALELDSLTAVKAMLDDPREGYATILPAHSVAADAASGRFAVAPIADPAMRRTIALLRPAAGGRALPPSIAERILARAAELRRVAEGVA